MSAILGRIDFSGRPVDPAAFERALGTLTAYGGTASGRIVLPGVALGHHHRAVSRNAVPEGAPYRLPDLAIVADAVLDDRDGLRAALGPDAPVDARSSDSALILCAYRKWGTDCLPRLVGDFAFAIHDARLPGLVLACDHIGTRPLHLARRNGALLFATSPRAFLAFDDMGWAIDETRVAGYLMRQETPSLAGFLAGTERVEPGTVQIHRPDGVDRTRWWDPRAAPEIRFRRDEDYAAGLREVSEIAVRARLETDLPVGSHLSGGIDSVAVTVLAARALAAHGKRLAAAYSWSPPVSAAYPDMGAEDERRTIAAIAEREGLTVRYGTADGRTMHDLLARPIEIEGTADLAEELATAGQAARDGIGVMLSGWGGDEGFSAPGHGYASHLLRHGRLVSALRLARRATARRSPLAHGRWLWRQGVGPWLTDRAPPSTHPLFPDEGFIAPALRRRAAEPPPALGIRPDPHAQLAQLLTWGHLAVRMETWAAWGAEHGIVYRYPLLDRRVLEYVMGLPADAYLADGRSRSLAVRSLADLVPEKLRKTDRANDARRMAQYAGCWSRLAADAAEGAFDAAGDWVDRDALVSAVSGVPDQIDKADLLRFGSILAAARMCQVRHRWSA